MCLLPHFGTEVTVKPKSKSMGRREAGGGGGRQARPKRSANNIVKNIPHGFSKKFSSPNLISEAVLFINYLSVFFYLIVHTIESSKIQL